MSWEMIPHPLYLERVDYNKENNSFFPTNGGEATRYSYRKKKIQLNPYLMSYTKFISKQIIDLNVKAKTSKLLTSSK